ncbi:MAG: hypothetical protein LBQ60_06515 [Bacteroidales bacterium]|jgi:hypothetical protein|nr:hypothetical protein [Bacteroidales bacterium]
MNVLTEKQIDFISEKINGCVQLSREMKDDLIDHFSCTIEDEMVKGKDFEMAYRFVFEKVCPEGLDGLIKETSYIPTTTKRKRLSRILRISGIFTLVGFTATVFMKLFHIPFGQIVLMLTAVVCIFLLIPALFLYFFQKKMGIRQIGKFPYVAGCIGTVLLIVSVVFYTSHWPGLFIALLSAVLCIDFAVFPLIFTNRYKTDMVI